MHLQGEENGKSARTGQPKSTYVADADDTVHYIASMEPTSETGFYTSNQEYSDELVYPNNATVDDDDAPPSNEDAFSEQWWGEGTCLVSTDLVPTLLSPFHTICPSRPPALLGSGDGCNVVGQVWIGKWSQTSMYDWKRAFSVIKRVFRFGDSQASPSLGSLFLNAFVISQAGARIPMVFRVDVLMNTVPFLISRRALAAMKVTLNFRDAPITSQTEKLHKLKFPKGGI